MTETETRYKEYDALQERYDLLVKKWRDSITEIEELHTEIKRAQKVIEVMNETFQLVLSHNQKHLTE